MTYVVGIDAGGTSTRAAVADDRGRVLAYGRGGAGNPTSAGLDLALTNVTTAVVPAVRAAGVTPDLVMLTLAGGQGFDADEGLRQRLHAEGIDTRVQTAGDVLSAYFSGTAVPDGALILSGTGATGARVVDGELDLVSDGIGWLLGDDGSGFWIGREVVRAAARDLEGRGPATSLTALVAAEVADQDAPGDLEPGRISVDLRRLIRRVYGQRPVECAGFAPLALAAAREGDQVATKILDGALTGLLTTCERVTSREDDSPLVLAGGLLHDGSPLADGIRAVYGSRCVRAQEGTAGAVLLGLRRAGAPADDQTLATVLRTLAEQQTPKA